MNFLTLWELGHRLAEKNPYRSPYLPLHHAVKDAFRLLVTEIYNGRLVSSLIYEKHTPEHDLDPEYYIRDHLNSIWDIQAAKRFPRRFLQSVFIDRVDFELWCIDTEFTKPEFWFKLDTNYYHYADDELEGKEPTAEPIGKRAKTNQAKTKIQHKAKSLWANQPDMNITDMANHAAITDISKHWSFDTVRKWLRPVAPDHIKGKRGRPKKMSQNSIL
jgi:hypothetical protein